MVRRDSYATAFDRNVVYWQLQVRDYVLEKVVNQNYSFTRAWKQAMSKFEKPALIKTETENDDCEVGFDLDEFERLLRFSCGSER